MMRNRILRVLAGVLVFAIVLGAMPATPALALTGSVTLSQTSGPPGTLVGVSCTGFTANVTYNVVWDGTVNVATGNTTSGNFTTQFNVPTNYPRGTYGVTVSTTADTSNTASFTVTPRVALSVASGNVGDQITVTGDGFSASTSVTVYYDAAAVLTATSTTSGTLSVVLTIPASQWGSHSIRGADAWGDSTIAVFNVLHKMTVSPTQATVGTPLSVTGTGFGASQAVSVFFDEVLVSSTVTDSVGSFSLANFAMPPSVNGAHTIRAQDAMANSASVTVNTVQSIKIDPSSGPVGTRVTVSGSGFRANDMVAITYDNAAIGSAVSTDAKGSFTATVEVPASSSGLHQFRAADSFYADTKNFSVTAAATATPTSGFVGARVSVTGTGFLAAQTVSILFDNTIARQVTADAQGSFNTTFDVPARRAGVYKIRVTDGANAKDIDFNVTTNATITTTSAASPGFVGSSVTVSGVGFKAGAALSVTYDAREIATGTVGTDGSFSVTFKAPASKAGQHTVTVTDGVVTVPLAFFMEGNAPPAPTLLAPQGGTTAKAEATFAWSPVTDPSGVTYVLQVSEGTSFSPTSMVLEKTGLSAAEYKVLKTEKLKPNAKGTAYYWRVRAIDGASNEGAWSTAMSFTVATPFPAWALWTLVGLGALIILLFAFWAGRRTGVSRPRPTGSES